MLSIKRWHVAAAIAVGALFIATIESPKPISDEPIPQPLVAFDSAWNTGSYANYRKPPTHNRETHIVYVQPGQNLTSLLTNEGLSAQQVVLLALTAQPLIDLGRLQIGAPLEISFNDNDQPRVRLAKEYGEIIDAIYENGAWSVTKQTVPLRAETHEAAVTISSSLYEDAVAEDVPVTIINSAMMALSHFVDFQRQLQPGDIFEAQYARSEVVRDKALFSHLQNPLKLSYLRFTNGGEDYRMYRFDGTFYFEDGRVAQSFLLKTPLNGARLTSHYGNRYHPVLGYNRQHKGIDFSAPVGTPIMAAGRGTIKHASPKGSFGNAVIIEHAQGYETLYAHLDRFNEDIDVGDYVSQGDIIGYLGNTGLSAGRHLHYEVYRNGRTINPVDIKVPSDRRLSGVELARFKRYLAQLKSQASELAGLAP